MVLRFNPRFRWPSPGCCGGFSVVELLLVLLLVTALAYVALPRFLSAGGSAEALELRGFAGRLEAAAALFRARWQAEGTRAPAAPPTSFAGLRVNGAGYPQGFAGDGVVRQGLATAEDCRAVVTALLGSRSPPLTAVAGVEDLGTVADGLAVIVALPFCHYYPARSEGPHVDALNFIEYDSRNGRTAYRQLRSG